jgi:hypothetical protein
MNCNNNAYLLKAKNWFNCNATFSKNLLSEQKKYMKNSIIFYLICYCLIGCQKDKEADPPKTCDIQQAYTDNAKKVTIQNGVWGTVANTEGDCMPIISPCRNCCSTCPVKRTVKIYQYTLNTDASTSDPGTAFFDSFNTPLVAQVDTDENGFFQATLPAGRYTIVIVENGKLYAPISDGQGGLSPFTLATGTLNVNLSMTYKAVF